MEKKILFVHGCSFSLHSIGELLQIYTLNNGTLPNEINMSKDGLKYYESLLMPMNRVGELKFNGIKINVNE